MTPYDVRMSHNGVCKKCWGLRKQLALLPINDNVSFEIHGHKAKGVLGMSVYRLGYDRDVWAIVKGVDDEQKQTDMPKVRA